MKDKESKRTVEARGRCGKSANTTWDHYSVEVNGDYNGIDIILKLPYEKKGAPIILGFTPDNAPRLMVDVACAIEAHHDRRRESVAKKSTNSN